MQLIDIGANLGHDSFDHDLDAVLQRARAAGVVQLVVTGASREGSPKALQLAQAHPGLLYATAGVHPHHASEYTDECDAELRALHAHPEVVAVGECGLDYFRDLVPHIPAQRLMIETDSPYLLPRTVKPQPSHRRNEPMYLAHIVEELARDRGEAVEDVAAATTAAANAFFRLPS